MPILIVLGFAGVLASLIFWPLVGVLMTYDLWLPGNAFTCHSCGLGFTVRRPVFPGAKVRTVLAIVLGVVLLIAWMAYTTTLVRR